MKVEKESNSFSIATSSKAALELRRAHLKQCHKRKQTLHEGRQESRQHAAAIVNTLSQYISINESCCGTNL